MVYAISKGGRTAEINRFVEIARARGAKVIAHTESPTSPLAELADLLLREAQPEGGDDEGTILISHLQEAISTAAGETDHSLISPVGDVSHSLGEMAIMGIITWA